MEFYYYAWEQNGTANRRLQEIRASKKIKEGKWRCIERDNADLGGGTGYDRVLFLRTGSGKGVLLL